MNNINERYGFDGLHFVKFLGFKVIKDYGVQSGIKILFSCKYQNGRLQLYECTCNVIELNELTIDDCYVVNINSINNINSIIYNVSKRKIVKVKKES